MVEITNYELLLIIKLEQLFVKMLTMAFKLTFYNLNLHSKFSN